MTEENPILEHITELNPEAIVLDGLDDAIVGVGHSKDLEPRLIYSVNIIILFSKRKLFFVTPEDASVRRKA